MWGLDLPPVIAGQYLMLGFGLLMGGLFLYVYANKNKISSNHEERTRKVFESGIAPNDARELGAKT